MAASNAARGSSLALITGGGAAVIGGYIGGAEATGRTGGGPGGGYWGGACVRTWPGGSRVMGEAELNIGGGTLMSITGRGGGARGGGVLALTGDLEPDLEPLGVLGDLGGVEVGV